MLRLKSKQISLYSQLYNKIPENHILKRIESVVNFSFINKLLEKQLLQNFWQTSQRTRINV